MKAHDGERVRGVLAFLSITQSQVAHEMSEDDSAISRVLSASEPGLYAGFRMGWCAHKLFTKRNGRQVSQNPR